MYASAPVSPRPARRRHRRAFRSHSAASPGMSGSSLHTASAAQHSTSTRSEEHTSELQSLMRNSYAVFCLKKKNKTKTTTNKYNNTTIIERNKHNTEDKNNKQ